MSETENNGYAVELEAPVTSQDIEVLTSMFRESAVGEEGRVEILQPFETAMKILRAAGQVAEEQGIDPKTILFQDAMRLLRDKQRRQAVLEAANRRMEESPIIQ